MNSNIHPPGIMNSKQCYFLGSSLTNQKISDTILITEELIYKVKTPWKINGTVTANNGYKLIKKWEKGKNYCIEKIINKNNEPVGFYIDICSPIVKKGSIFEYKDWYLDIFYDASSNKKPIILDKKELEEALRSNFLTQEEANIANKTARFLIEALKRKDFIDF